MLHLVLLVRRHGGGDVAEFHKTRRAARPAVHLDLLETRRSAKQLLQL